MLYIDMSKAYVAKKATYQLINLCKTASDESLLRAMGIIGKLAITSTSKCNPSIPSKQTLKAILLVYRFYGTFFHGRRNVMISKPSLGLMFLNYTPICNI